ncbi:sulfite exporter TauE/SafE family protein [Candidatus Sulfidibacterium hydrothermale]|uniref:sulfite exporter TauE/SafE family protein n=1 Tax=Candidatus Sulfidibacterium hydrothermale TaxID=2875962 RepID=UPI001F0A5BC0|nr:sulfite exporter TauE/SafE family protein [Candidatus Sulfidibacterium hydrothermale]UBM62966.1 sulfite exporter TauE/SafE family protein [Candidatus Sulfidibacterium hydrothermale]
MNLAELLILILSGVVVGFINTLAGGGSIISLSILIMLGLPATVANGTNRVAIALQNVVAVSSFKQQKVLEIRKALYLSIPAIFGSIVGAWIAVDINEAVFEKAIGIIMLVMLIFVLFKPQQYIYGRAEISEKPVRWGTYVAFFFIGIYAGFIHMGVGYFLLAGIVLGAGYDLVKANAIKVLIILAYAPFTLVVFFLHHEINWIFGLVMALGNMLGAWLASRMAVKKGVNFVKWVIVLVILMTSAQMFGIYDFKSLLFPLTGQAAMH